MKYSHTPYLCPEVDAYYAIPVECVADLVNPVSKQIDKMPNGTEEDPEDIPEDFIHLSDDKDEAYRVLAVRIVEDDWDGTYDISRYDEHVVRCGRMKWRVLTDEEADRAASEQLDAILEDIVLSEIPESYREYFNKEEWKKDTMAEGGRGPILASHNDYEDTADFPEYETLYVYRIN